MIDFLHEASRANAPGTRRPCKSPKKSPQSTRSLPMEKLNVWERNVAAHLKQHRPKMYRELMRSGQLEATCRKMWEEYTNQLADLVSNQGLPYNQAEELAQPLAFPQSESDQPLLGENPNKPDPITAAITY
jgi:hypothetical protein